MLRRIVAIGFIFASATLAWAILGSTLFYRSYRADAALRSRVQSTWGAPHEQSPPVAGWEDTRTVTETVTENGRSAPRTFERLVHTPIPLESSRIRVDLALAHRQKGLLWFSTYGVAFDGTYRFRNAGDRDRRIRFDLRLPAQQAVYDGLILTVDGRPLVRSYTGDTVSGSADVAAGATAALRVAYRSQGLDSWSYKLGGDVAEARDFELRMRTDFAAVDFPDNALSPTTKIRQGKGWELAWSYRSLLSGFRIAMTMPEHLQPGPLAGRISYFAPVSLFFFFFLMWILTTMRGIDLHPMNYFFLAAAFFAFHLLLAYLVDHVTIHVAFAIASLVSIALVVSYLRIVIGGRFAIVEAGIAQLLYLVLFSYAFFFEGWTGLAITIGAVLTLFVTMQMTARIRWSDAFAGRREAPMR